MSFLRIQSLSKQYGDSFAVSNFNLEVQKGEFVSLLGPSGCGKTTTLQMIAGFVDATSGSIQLDGRDITRVKPNDRGLGIVFQTYALFPHMTVRQNVEFGLEMRKCPKKEREERTMQALALVHLENHGGRYPRELSGGQRQRVALARALVIRPSVLLLDEPLSNLDAKLREEMQFELREIQRKVGTTTIMVTHDQAEAMSISDRVVVMEAGKITQVGTPHEVYEHPGNQFISTFVGKTNVVNGRLQSEQGQQCWVAGALQHPQVQGTAASAASLALRPEKIQIVAAGSGLCDGTVTQQFFLGNMWMYTVQTAMGEMLVSAINDGTPAHDVGATVGLRWDARNVRLIESTGAAR